MKHFVADLGKAAGGKLHKQRVEVKPSQDFWWKSFSKLISPSPGGSPLLEQLPSWWGSSPEGGMTGVPTLALRWQQTPSLPMGTPALAWMSRESGRGGQDDRAQVCPCAGRVPWGTVSATSLSSSGCPMALRPWGGHPGLQETLSRYPKPQRLKKGMKG